MLARARSHPFNPVVLALIAVGMVLLVSSCRTTSAKRPFESPGALRRELARAEAAVRELEEENGQQSLRLIEQKALIRQLEERVLSQQQILDDAIQEVVRVKAKQRSLESRAEAATEMAEAEIALKSLRGTISEPNRPKLANAERLLMRAAEEFDNQNFGGALYLISQAKGQIRLATLLQGERIERLEGELPFAVPLPLVVKTRGNLREGPGLDFRVLVTLEAGTPITGHSFKEPWLRVKSQTGRMGWIHRSLVSANQP